MADGDAGAGAAARRRHLREEEEMTNYSTDERDNVEFKIVRANLGIFGKPAEFKKLIQEEGRAGWELVEKFDNRRVRFKRPSSARERDSLLPAGVDPYRTQSGMSPMLFVLLLILIAFIVVCLIYAAVIGLGGLIYTNSHFFH
jgi:hypothetical protein